MPVRLLQTQSQGKSPTRSSSRLRADFYAECSQFPNLREALAQHQEFIGPMNAAELRRAIEEPAKRGMRRMAALGNLNPVWLIYSCAIRAKSRGLCRCSRTRCWRRGRGGAGIR